MNKLLSLSTLKRICLLSVATLFSYSNLAQSHQGSSREALSRAGENCDHRRIAELGNYVQAHRDWARDGTASKGAKREYNFAGARKLVKQIAEPSCFQGPIRPIELCPRLHTSGSDFFVPSDPQYVFPNASSATSRLLASSWTHSVPVEAQRRGLRKSPIFQVPIDFVPYNLKDEFNDNSLRVTQLYRNGTKVGEFTDIDSDGTPEKLVLFGRYKSGAEGGKWGSNLTFDLNNPAVLNELGLQDLLKEVSFQSRCSGKSSDLNHILDKVAQRVKWNPNNSLVAFSDVVSTGADGAFHGASVAVGAYRDIGVGLAKGAVDGVVAVGKGLKAIGWVLTTDEGRKAFRAALEKLDAKLSGAFQQCLVQNNNDWILAYACLYGDAAKRIGSAILEAVKKAFTECAVAAYDTVAKGDDQSSHRFATCMGNLALTSAATATGLGLTRAGANLTANGSRVLGGTARVAGTVIGEGLGWGAGGALRKSLTKTLTAVSAEGGVALSKKAAKELVESLTEAEAKDLSNYLKQVKKHRLSLGHPKPKLISDLANKLDKNVIEAFEAPSVAHLVDSAGVRALALQKGHAPEYVDSVLKNANLTEEERIREAAELLQLNGLSVQQQNALNEAHLYRESPVSTVFNYTAAEKRKKLRILEAGGFSREEADRLYRAGLAGQAQTVTNPQLASVVAHLDAQSLAARERADESIEDLKNRLVEASGAEEVTIREKLGKSYQITLTEDNKAFKETVKQNPSLAEHIQKVETHTQRVAGEALRKQGYEVEERVIQFSGGNIQMGPRASALKGRRVLANGQVESSLFFFDRVTGEPLGREKILLNLDTKAIEFDGSGILNGHGAKVSCTVCHGNSLSTKSENGNFFLPANKRLINKIEELKVGAEIP